MLVLLDESDPNVDSLWSTFSYLTHSLIHFGRNAYAKNRHDFSSLRLEGLDDLAMKSCISRLGGWVTFNIH